MAQLREVLEERENGGEKNIYINVLVEISQHDFVRILGNGNSGAGKEGKKVSFLSKV